VTLRKLRKLTSEGRCLVDEHFLSDPTAKVPLDVEELERRHYVEDLKESIDLSGFNTLVDQVMKKFNPFDTHMDREISGQLHKALPLPRRDAGDTRTWHYLSVIERPDFVRHRWQPKDGRVVKERFLGDLVRNTFARLWWGAEKTLSPENGYGYTNSFSARVKIYMKRFSVGNSVGILQRFLHSSTSWDQRRRMYSGKLPRTSITYSQHSFWKQ